MVDLGILTPLIDGLGMAGDGLASIINAIFTWATGQVVPFWVGKIVLLVCTGLFIWSVQKKLPRIILIGCVLMAVLIIFGGSWK
jgi:hypothetical protein